MKIISLEAENIKRLVAVEIHPDTNLVEITGKNGQGKTSVLDAIWWALGSQKVVQQKPVRDGQDNGFVRLDLGEYVVTRKFKAKDGGEYTTSITVENKEGARYQSPQEVLNGFVGQLTFDPLAFARMKPADQAKSLRALVPEFNFAANEMEAEALFDERTNAKRRLRDLEGQLSSLPEIEDAPAERASVGEVLDRIGEAMRENTAVDRAENELRRLEGQVEGRENAIADSKQRIADLESRLAAEREGLKSLETELEELRDLVDSFTIPARVDVAAMKARLDDLERINDLFDKAEERKRIADLVSGQQQVVDDLTVKIDKLRETARNAVAAAKLPVEGLSFTDDGVFVGDVPFDQLSDAQRLRVSIAVAGSMNPKLRIVRVRDGSLLDNEAMAELKTYAEANDLQVWIERVSDGEGTGVVIEDGRVRGAAVAVAAE